MNGAATVSDCCRFMFLTSRQLVGLMGTHVLVMLSTRCGYLDQCQAESVGIHMPRK